MNCEHVRAVPADEVPPLTPEGCGECLAIGEDDWVQLRLCLTCGNVGCCDSSPHRHATRHYEKVGHPVMRSFEPGQNWRWCYQDNRIV